MKENYFKRTIFVPVGTSLIVKAEDPRCRIYSEWSGNLIEDLSGFREDIKKVSAIDDQDLELVRAISWKKWKGCFRNEDAINFFSKYTKVKPIDEIAKRKNGELEYKPDKLTAELASLYLFYEEEMKEKNDTGAKTDDLKDEIILLASDTDQGLYCACFLAEYLRQQEPYKDLIGEVRVERIIGLVGDESDTFGKQGLDNIISQTTELIKERQGKRPLYLNVTGGYKGVLPYLVLLGLAFGKMDVFYLFELSDKIVWLPKLPVGFDLFTWRNYRAFIRSIPHIEGLKEEDLETLIPDTLRTLLERKRMNKKFPLNALGKELHDQYEGERGKEISEYGRGYLLTDAIKDTQKQKALRDCINRWQYLWLGDLIPEMVEHARGHAQRDLELLAQIICPILTKEPDFFGKDKTDDSLLVLLSSIWLHDLGHSGDHLRCKQDEMTIRDISDTEVECEEIERDIKGFPTLVRDIHHILSWYLIEKDKDELFKFKRNNDWVRDKTIFDDNLIKAIRQICLYHRGKMPVVNGHDPYKHIGLEIKESLGELNSYKVNLPLLGALLRIVDEGDVQEERTISKEYEAMRTLQNEREIEKLKIEEKKYRDKFLENSSFSQLPDYLNYLKEISSQYFNEDALKLDDEYKKFTNINGDKKKMKELERIKKENPDRCNYALFGFLVEKCIQKYIQDEGLNDIDDTKIVLRNWLSALDQYVFKRSTGPHFEKHSGISAIMYLPDKPKEENNKNEYHYKVLAIHKEGKDDRERVKFLKNVKKVLTEEIKKEYEKVKDILNDHHIYFDTYWMMEEGNDEMHQVWPQRPSDFRSGK